MSNTLSKEKQSPYERWEMASFGDDRHKVASTSTASVAKLAEQITAAREQARLEGYAAGLAEGRSTGLQEGRGIAAEEALFLQSIATAFQEEIAQANELIAQDMLDLALDIAKAMLKTTLEVHPDRIIPIISEAVQYLPTVQQPAILSLNPADADILRQHMGDELSKAGWRVSEDPHIERGGCRVETASNQIDATTPTRWQRITSALGKSSDWLAT